MNEFIFLTMTAGPGWELSEMFLDNKIPQPGDVVELVTTSVNGKEIQFQLRVKE